MLFSQSVSSASMSRTWRMADCDIASIIIGVTLQKEPSVSVGSARISAVKHSGVLTLLALIFLLTFSIFSLAADKTAAKPGTGSLSASLHIMPDLDQRLAKFRRIEMPFDKEQLPVREQKMVGKLV